MSIFGKDEPPAIEPQFKPGDVVGMKADNSAHPDSDMRMKFAIAELSEDEARGLFIARLVWVDRSGAMQIAMIPTEALEKL